MNRRDYIGAIALTVAFLSAFALALYNNCFDGFLNLSMRWWDIIWSIASNLIIISLIIKIMTVDSRAMGNSIAFTFIPYMLMKMLYDISAYGQIAIFNDKWQERWDRFMVMILIICVIFCCFMYKRWLRKS